MRRHADRALDIINEAEPERADSIRELKFSTFNQEWLEVVEGRDDSDGPAGEDAAAVTQPPGTPTMHDTAGLDFASLADNVLSDLKFTSPEAVTQGHSSAFSPSTPPAAGAPPRTPASPGSGGSSGGGGRDSGVLLLGDEPVELPEDEGSSDDEGARASSMMRTYVASPACGQ